MKKKNTLWYVQTNEKYWHITIQKKNVHRTLPANTHEKRMTHKKRTKRERDEKKKASEKNTLAKKKFCTSERSRNRERERKSRRDVSDPRCIPDLPLSFARRAVIIIIITRYFRSVFSLVGGGATLHIRSFSLRDRSVKTAMYVQWYIYTHCAKDNVAFIVLTAEI